MVRMGRRGFSDFEQAEIWRGWKSGRTLRSISRSLGWSDMHVRNLVSASGGFAPPPRRRSSRVLSRREREEISRGIVTRKLRLWGSPEQISGWLKEEYLDVADMQISHETIYRSLFIQARGVLKKELQEHLRTRRTIRRSRHATLRKQSRGCIVDAISISERPAEIEDRAIPGHWEGDLIAGTKQSYIATLVERHSRFVMLVKVEGKSSPAVVKALIKQVRHLPRELMKSLTWDRGLEMARHKEFTIATNVEVYFCDPRSPWQRGTNENTNRLLRQYLPKQSDLAEHSQAKLNKIARQLNQRPRKTLKFKCPADKLSEFVALTV